MLAMPASEPPPAAAPRATGVASVDKLPAAIGGSLRAAAAKGDPAAQYEIAQRYAEGRGVPQNLTEAAAWFDHAAKQGLAPAQFRLGGFYEKGFGVKKDLDAARNLYLAAAGAGNAKAMHNLAVLYAEGIDGKPDYQNAAKWFRKAADYGLTDSQYNLGILYGRGIGMEPNLPEAYKWFTLAARDGDRESAAKRDDVAGRLDAQALAAAKLAVQSWTALEQPEAATQAAVPPAAGTMAQRPHPAPPSRAAQAPNPTVRPRPRRAESRRGARFVWAMPGPGNRFPLCLKMLYRWTAMPGPRPPPRIDRSGIARTDGQLRCRFIFRSPTCR